ncbi:hypothetical protein Cgig2_013325 [Carnegiea gigantea]|uniref:Ubiquitin-like protease family profile domain-containing protein n=1 Tax=Carnegiea gigantea TaxID=171969 RepID=A0A9Q1JGB0_9CARY|nr:hypothetical protein Cgig2_013325 [Carnegiea gigantea]
MYVTNPEFASVSDHAVTLDVKDGVGFSSVSQMAVYFTNPEFASVHNEEDYGKTIRGAGSSCSEGGQQGSLMDEEWGMSSGSEYVPSETGSSIEDTVSMVDESCEAVGGSSSKGDDAEEVHADSTEDSGKGKSQKKRREPTMEGRRWRRKAAGDGFMFDKEGRGLKGVVPEPYQKEAIEETILKPILEYRPFSMQRELTAAPVKAWVLWRKAFRLPGRLPPLSVYDVALFTGLPVTGKIVEFGEDDLSTTELVRMVRLRMAQYVTEKSDNLKSEKGRKRPVFRNYIKVIKKLLNANKALEKLELWLSLYAWRVMSGVMFLRTPYRAAWSVQKYMEDVCEMGEYMWAEAVWRVLIEAVEEIQWKLKGPVFDVQMNGFSLLTQVIPVLHPQEEEMLLPTVRAFMNTDGFRDYILDGEELRAEKGKHVDALRMLEFWESHTHELEAQLNRYAAPAAQQDTRHQPGVSRMFSLVLKLSTLAKERMIWHRLHVGKMMPVHRSPHENSSSWCWRLGSQVQCPGCTLGRQQIVHMPRRTGGDTAATYDPGIEFVHHAPPTTADSAAADHEACVQPPVGDSEDRVTTPEQDGEIPGEIERTSSDAGDVGCRDDSGGNNSNIVTHMRRKPQSQRPAVVHCNPFTDPTRLWVLEGYISAPLSAMEMELVTKGRGHAGVSVEAHVSKLVTRPHPCGSKGGSRGQVTLHNKGRISGVICDNFKATPQPDVRYRSFLVYDSLPSPAAKTKRELLDSTRIAFVLTFLYSITYVDAGQWEVITPKCPEQKNGHDYGVFVMAFMNLLSLKADGFEFDQDCVAHYRDKCLLSFI